MTLRAFFEPRSVAIVGASADAERIGGRPLAYLLDTWCPRAPGRVVYPVNPGRSEVQGAAAFPTVAAIGAPVDLAILAVPASRLEDALRDCVTARCAAAIVFSSGFAELGAQGRALQARVEAIARAGGIRLLGPNCLGVIDVPNGFYATFSEVARRRDHTPGAISVASQSGAVAVQLLALGRRSGAGFNKLISTGNEQDVDVAEAIAYLARDPGTKAIIAYLEGCGDGERLISALETARDNAKPVIVIKVGRSERGSQATLSHTGALAGEDRVFDAVFRQFGAYRASGFDDALDIARLCVAAGRARGPRLGLMSISGGVGALMADAADAEGLDVAPIAPGPERDALAAASTFATIQNPLDITAQAINDTRLWRLSLEAMLAGNGYDALIAFLTFVGESPVLSGPVIDSMAAVRAKHPETPIVFCSLCSPETRAKAELAGFIVFEDPTRAVKAVAGWAKLTRRASEQDQTTAPKPAPAVARQFADSRNELEALRMLEQWGIPTPRPLLARSLDEVRAASATRPGPVVLKICSPDIAHKTEVGGVALGLQGEAQIAAAYQGIMQNVTTKAPQANIDGVIVADQIEGGVELLLGGHRDPVFGPMIMLGFGGIHVETLKDVAMRQAPLHAQDVADMLGELKARALLSGARGQPPADVEALQEAVVRFAALFAAAPSLASAEINPLLVRPKGKGVVALDCLVQRSGEEKPS